MLIIGCASQPVVPRSEPYALDCLELDESWQDPLRDATLQRWRDRAPEGFHHILTAWRAFTADPLSERKPPELGDVQTDDWGLLRPTDTLRHHWRQWTIHLRILRPSAVVFRTPVGFSPSQKHRDNLERFFREIVGTIDPLRVWVPGGLWEMDDARELAEPLGLIVARDPFLEPDLPEVPDGPAYYTLTGPWGGRRRFSDDDLELFLDFAAEHTHPVFAVFRGPERFFWGERLRTLAAAHAGDADHADGGDDR